MKPMEIDGVKGWGCKMPETDEEKRNAWELESQVYRISYMLQDIERLVEDVKSGEITMITNEQLKEEIEKIIAD